MNKKRRLRAHAFQDPDANEVETLIRTQLDYLVAEGVCVIDRIDEFGEAVYRLKTEEEIQAELDAITNS
jgi:hypothetical protein